jgi:hypothetical protein
MGDRSENLIGFSSHTRRLEPQLIMSKFGVTIDHENKPIGSLLKVILENDIIDLRAKVKEEKPNDLKDVDAHHLVVWRCKGEQVFDDEDRSDLKLQLEASSQNDLLQKGSYRTRREAEDK